MPPVTKTEGGQSYGASCYLVVPDSTKPSTWRLRYKEMVNGKALVTQAQLGRAAAALSPGGFRGNPVELTDEQRTAAMAKLRSLYDKNGWEMPAHMMPESANAASKSKTKESMSYDDLEQKLRVLIDPPDSEGHRHYDYYTKETYPGFCVVEANSDGKLYRVEYTVDADDNITLGQWQEAEYILQVKGEVKTSWPPEPVISSVTEGANLEGSQPGDIVELTTLIEAPADAEGKAFRVTVLRPGWNQTLDGKPGDKYYTRQACASLVPLLASAKAYADHPTKVEENMRPERSIRDLVGWYTDPRQETDGRTTAALNVLESAGWLRSLLKEAPHLVGLSINGFGVTKLGTAEGRRGKIVESIANLRSADVVTESGAGGEVEQLIASKQASKTKESDEGVELKDLTIEVLRQQRPDLFQAIGQERLTEAKGEIQKDLDALKTGFDQQLTALKESATAENKKLRDELVAERAKGAVKTRTAELLRESKLPEVSQRRLAVLLEGRGFVKDGAVDETALKEAVTAAVTDEKAYLAQLTESGRVVGMGSGGEPPNATDRAKTVQDKMDKMFGIEQKPAVPAVGK